MTEGDEEEPSRTATLRGLAPPLEMDAPAAGPPEPSCDHRSTVRQYMRGLAHVWQATSIAATARLMASTRMKELVVLDDQGGPIGIISAQDLVARRTLGDDARVVEVMAASVGVVDQDVPVATAAARMLSTKRDQLVVVDDKGIAVGCISMNDVLRWLVFPR